MKAAPGPNGEEYYYYYYYYDDEEGEQNVSQSMKNTWSPKKWTQPNPSLALPRVLTLRLAARICDWLSVCFTCQILTQCVINLNTRNYSVFERTHFGKARKQAKWRTIQKKIDMFSVHCVPYHDHLVKIDFKTSWNGLERNISWKAVTCKKVIPFDDMGY